MEDSIESLRVGPLYTVREWQIDFITMQRFGALSNLILLLNWTHIRTIRRK